ncbi:cytochrome C [Pseudorhodobacter sp. E13]|uniref:c-type cytochrome n=1 Tax=Pseudorhodobacter sp. E13 TaxID=2487931 RepID=UPI000F8DC447|nr:c-type cytochrome [Pseudorhodobacter sp. E13]RUS59638.1 cytochrome C [Pseudorhodobacter sp. E13]
MGSGRFLLALLLTAPGLVGPGAAETLGDAAKGADIFGKECKQCHMVGPDAKNRIGPSLNGIYGRRAGSMDGFKYSKSMARMGADGLDWTIERLDAYIENPKALVSGTRMNYRGLTDPTQRHDLMAFLRDYSDSPQNIPEAQPTAIRTVPDLAPEILALEGDPEYGEYLSAECTTCHQKDGSADGIPSITNWPEEDFVAALHAYKVKLRPHPVMQMMAGRLSNEEIAALAAYYATIED